MLRWTPKAGSRIGRLVTASVLLFALNVVLAVVYLVPAWSNPPIHFEGRVSIVSYISSFGPWWSAAFAVTGLAGIAAIAWRRGLELAHAGSMIVSGAYAAALWFGAFASDPHTSLVLPIVATAYCVFHKILADVYAEASR